MTKRGKSKESLASVEREFGSVSSWEGSFDDIESSVRARHFFSSHVSVLLMDRLCVHLETHSLTDRALDALTFGVPTHFDDQKTFERDVGATTALYEAYFVDSYPHEQGPREILPVDLRRVVANLRKLGHPIVELEEALSIA